MKLSKNKKIVLLITGLGILTTSIVTPIVVINNKNKDNKQSILDYNTKQNSKDLNKANEIIAKIKDKDILIAPNVSTQNQSEIQNAIKAQLKKENQTLNEVDLSKITINNIDSLTLGNQIEVTLIIKVKNTNKELKINVEKINLLKNSNVIDGHTGIIFQDKFKNLWVMGNRKELQVLKANDFKDGYVKSWINNNNNQGLLNGSNINNGFYGTIFQDSFENLWAMGKRTPLQVLKANSNGDSYASEGWINNITKGLTKGSNIIDGSAGTLFQDSFKNLWAMGIGTKLQVLKVNSSDNGYVNEGWTNDTNQGLTKGSNITNDFSGTIFQDKFKNLWTMSYGKKLQVLKVNNSKDDYVESWTHDINQGLTKGSNINNGFYGTIFQDSFENLWAMGKRTPLQVLKVNNSKDGYVESWTDVQNIPGLLNGSNITNGSGGRIFQDKFKNLWAMSVGTPLQVLKANDSKDDYVESWTHDINQGLTKGSNITNGSGGRIFQDSFGNLWAMSVGTPLQVLKVNNSKNGYVESWTDVQNIPGLLNGSNITNGIDGRIFQDSFGNLWAMGKKLQVLIASPNNIGYINSWLYEENKK